MTDDTQTTTVEPDESEATAGDAVEAAGPAALEAVEHEEAPGWFERYVLPLLIPLVIVAGLLFYVINVSRMFLSSPGAGAVTMVMTITIAILGGAALMSAAPRMRTSSMALIVLGGMLVILMGGSLTLGASEEKEAEVAFPEGQPDLNYGVKSGNLWFDPTAFDVETGVFSITLTNTQSGQHTFVIETPGPITDKPELEVSGEGSEDSFRVFVGDAGDYVFYCSIPGHRAAGMEGVFTAAGDSITFEEATAQLSGGGAGGDASA